MLLLQKPYILTSLLWCSCMDSKPIPCSWKLQMAFLDPCMSSKYQSCTGVRQARKGVISALHFRVGHDQLVYGLGPTEPQLCREIEGHEEFLFLPLFFSKCMLQQMSAPSQKWLCIEVTFSCPFLPSGGQNFSRLWSTGMNRSHHRSSHSLLFFMAVASPKTSCPRILLDGMGSVTHSAQVAPVFAQGTLRSGSGAALWIRVL